MDKIQGKLLYILLGSAIVFVIGQFTTEILCYASLVIGIPIILYLFGIAFKNVLK